MTMEMETLRAENAWLKERLAEVQGNDDQHTRLRRTFGLSPQQAAILALLLNTKRPVSVQAIYENVFEKPNGEGPLPDIIKAQISKLRTRLEAFKCPGTIRPAYGTGRYTLDPELREWIDGKLVTQ